VALQDADGEALSEPNIWALASSADVVSRGALREPWEVTTPVAVLNGGRGRRITG